jgi:hypothetical protein
MKNEITEKSKNITLLANRRFCKRVYQNSNDSFNQNNINIHNEPNNTSHNEPHNEPKNQRYNTNSYYKMQKNLIDY